MKTTFAKAERQEQIFSMTSPVRHLYVHFPYCPHVCPYCSFHVLPIEKKGSDHVVELLLQEFRGISSTLELETIFFGGGTPSSLSTKQISRLFQPITHQLTRVANVEVTCECNPSTLSVQKAEAMLKVGVNRLSIGAQSMDPEILKVLGRTHSVSAIESCFRTAREAGFTNLNIDLIFGVPHQTAENWKTTLEKVLDLNPNHISCYGLTFEEDTDFFRRMNAHELERDEELEREMFHVTRDVLLAAGFHQYEISNYALPGFESKHNLAYWLGNDYAGIGPSAVSTINGVRKTNGKYDGKGWSVASTENLSMEVLSSERMALGLRTEEGINPEEFGRRFGFKPAERWGKEIKTLSENQLIKVDPNIKLTERGREVADEVATYFV